MISEDINPDSKFDIYQKINQYIIDRVICNITGRNINEVKGNLPSANFYAGNIFPPFYRNRHHQSASTDIEMIDFEDENDREEVYAEEDESKVIQDTSRKSHPQSTGLRFMLKEMKGKIKISVSFDVWHRTFPSLDQLKKENLIGKEVKINDIILKNPSLRRFIKTGRIKINGVINLNSMNDLEKSINLINNSIIKELNNLADKAIEEDAIKVPNKNIKIVIQDNNYNDLIKNIKGEIKRPKWSAELQVEPENLGEEGWKLDIKIVNTSPQISYKDYDFYENVLFDVELTADATDCEILDQSPYDPCIGENHRVSAIGINCISQENFDYIKKVSTVSIPIYYEPKISHAKTPGLDIKELYKNPEKATEDFVFSMETYLKEVQSSFLLDLHEKKDDTYETYDKEFTDFKKEIERCKKALDLIKNNPIVRKAFVLSIQTMLDVAAAREIVKVKNLQPMYSWRAFQLGFILSNIPDIVSRRMAAMSGNNIELEVDMLHFPTAGGKTEAFMFLGIFNAFLDRLTGKTRGVSAWYVYPIRALSIQQLERLTELVYRSEQIRKKEKINGDPFSIGYLVGEGYTPNKIKKEDEKQLVRNIKNNPKKWVYIGRCPRCYDTNIHINWNHDEWSLEYICSNEDCKIKLPVRIVDDELQKKPATFLLGTIDKICKAGLTVDFHTFLRSPEYICPVHGAIRPYKDRCSMNVPELCNKKVIKLKNEDWGPSLFVMDEVHLLSEELGAYTSHYLSLIWDIQKSGSFPMPKIIAVTATSSEWMHHITHLTGKSARLFPSSPTLKGQNYYIKYEEKKWRTFIGIHPHGKTEHDATMHLLRAISGSLQELRKNKLNNILSENPGYKSLTDDEVADLLRPYETTVIYVLAKLQGDIVANSIISQLPGLMEVMNYEKINKCRVISSETLPGEMAEILENLANEKPHASDDRIDVICATSSIAYGVDIPNLNLLILLGQPRRMNEDIQVTSRVARHYPGIVFRLYHPTRQYDIAAYIHFLLRHTSKGRLVDPVAINRFAINGVRRTLPGILMAELYNTDEHRKNIQSLGRHSDAYKYLSEPENENRIRKIIYNIYMCGR